MAHKNDSNESLIKRIYILSLYIHYTCRLSGTGFLLRKSATDKGTLYQLKNLTHRTSVPSDPQDNMNAPEDFLQIVLDGYVVAADKAIMRCEWDGTIVQLADEIIKQYVQILPERKLQTPDEQMYKYSCEIILLGLIWYNYLDAIREGDGCHVMDMWKFLWIILKKSGRRNYAKDAAILLIQYHCLILNRKAAQVRNSRLINTVGRKRLQYSMQFVYGTLEPPLKGNNQAHGFKYSGPIIS